MVLQAYARTREHILHAELRTCRWLKSFHANSARLFASLDSLFPYFMTITQSQLERLSKEISVFGVLERQTPDQTKTLLLTVGGIKAHSSKEKLREQAIFEVGAVVFAAHRRVVR